MKSTYAIVVEEHRYAYLNIAKAGCTSIKTAIAKHVGVSFPEVMYDYPWRRSVHSIPSGMFVFTVVRHPLARLVSCWADYVVAPLQRELDMNPEFYDYDGLEFEEFAKLVFRRPVPNLHYAPQWPQISGRVSEIIRLEEIEREWPLLMQRLGIPDLPYKRRSKHDDWRTYYNDTLMDEAAAYYRHDVAHLGYSVEKVSAC